MLLIQLIEMFQPEIGPDLREEKKKRLKLNFKLLYFSLLYLVDEMKN